MDIGFCKLDGEGEKLHLLKIIRKMQKITRGQIVKLTGYSSAKISLLIKEMSEQELIEEVGVDESTGGRKAKLLQLKGDKGYFLGAELGSYELKISLIDFSGKALSFGKMPEDPENVEPEYVMKKLIDFIRGFINSNINYQPKLTCLGLALSGIVDDNTGVCRYFRNRKSWEGFPLKNILEDAFGLPCIIDDSSRMMAVAEKIYGHCRNINNFILFSIGVGLGTGIFIDGKLFRGSTGLAGELGHMVIKENGPRCICGNCGCLESLVSGYAIERELKEAINDNVYSSLMWEEDIDAKDVVEQAKEGDKLAYSIINKAAKHLGVGIANAINIFNPEMVILAGGISNAGKLLQEPIEQVVKASALAASAKNVKILLSGLNEYSASLGIANNCIDWLLNNKAAHDFINK